ncbi:unnamed protein product [Clonostachys rosea f. rosea IK726]|uniref:Uncharacterized protein n=1 Tax=Clonostachys rosea f. rosea IK726 TaxID=1349383 RepID=A0ACA9TRR0_BIOOC|nr:unnamed protein product [Clonostachys rosea f. rosea IK726]
MDTVYHICDGQKNAITPTHSVITASLILPTVSGDFVQFPPVTATTTSESTSTSTSTTSRQTLPTTLITETKPSPTSWSSSGRSSGRTSSTSSESSSSSSSASGSSSGTSSETPTTQTSSTASSTETSSVSTTSSTGAAVPPTGTGTSDDSGAGGSSPSLTKGQIAGISVGAAVAASFAIGAVVLIRCYRRRGRAETPPPEHFHNDQDHHRRMSTFAYLSGGNGGYDVDDRRWDPNPPRPSPDMSQIPHPPPFRHHHDGRPDFLSAGRGTRTPPPPPPGHEIRKVEGSESAFSSPRSRRMSKLLPAKPSMAPFLAPSYTSPSQLEAGQAYQPTSNLAPAASQSQQPHPADSGLVSPLEPQNKSQFPIPLRIQIPSEQEAEQTAPDARDSNITQFEEDANPAQDVLQFWKHPSGGARSDAPVYVRDKSGNWVLAESELGAALSPREPKSARSLSSSTGRPLSTSSRLGLAISTGTRSHQQPPVPTVTKSAQSQNRRQLLGRVQAANAPREVIGPLSRVRVPVLNEPGPARPNSGALIEARLQCLHGHSPPTETPLPERSPRPTQPNTR